MITKKEKMKEKIVKTWELMQGKMTTYTQKQVIERVLNGMSLSQSIRSEGLIFLSGQLDDDLIKLMFENGTLKVIDRQLEGKGTIHVMRENNTVYSQEKSVEGIEETEKVAFIPRPKKS